MVYLRNILILVLTFLSFTLIAQKKLEVTGTIANSDGEPIPFANVLEKQSKLGTTANEEGFYRLNFKRKDTLILIFSSVGFQKSKVNLVVKDNKEYILNVVLEPETHEIDEVTVSAKDQSEATLIKIDKKEIGLIPNVSGSIETIIATLPGVSAPSELSTQYNVRGGNFDENLVYVNDIEVYRPFLIRSGQQEGLSFVNSDMVSSIRFSAGGFDARYGDKMSSVLDITYNRPDKFGGNASVSLLGANVHFEDALSNGKFTYNVGFRYKTSKYLLNTLETEGNYDPSFYDLQTYLTYTPGKKFKLDFIGNYALNNYNFVPQTRTTSFGTINNALGITIYYQGNEKDQFETWFGALSGTYNINDDFYLKLIASAFTTSESETYDILGQYYLNELDKIIGSDTYGDSIMNIGVGEFLNHARNELQANVYKIEHKGGLFKSRNDLRWGVSYRVEEINDIIKEWKMLDSAGYSIPYDGSTIELYDVAIADNYLLTHRIDAFIADYYQFNISKGNLFLNAGLRFHYWDFSNQSLLSPRVSMIYIPEWQREVEFSFAAGYYYQPPFYKEIRNEDGMINQDIEAQQSIHFVLGSDYNFMAWGRPFKLTTELYYKYLDNLIPYKVDNLKIEYSAENMAHGYAYGIDMKVNGEFVRGIQSWASLSIMKTEEDIEGDYYYNKEGERIEPGYYSRPTDQRFNFSLFFQDYFPTNPTYTMQLSLHYGGEIPFSSPIEDRYDLNFDIPPYRRVDIGFSKVFKAKDDQNRNFLYKYVNSFWLSVEIFNLLDIDNTISYLWIKTVNNQTGESGYYAVPNYLTSRRLNVKLAIKF